MARRACRPRTRLREWTSRRWPWPAASGLPGRSASPGSWHPCARRSTASAGRISPKSRWWQRKCRWCCRRATAGFSSPGFGGPCLETAPTSPEAAVDRLAQAMRFVLTVILLCCASVAAGQQLKPWRGGEAPALALRDPDGRLHRLEDYRGKAVLVNFWAAWCEPCREEMPSMNRLRASLAGRPFEVLAVNLAESEQ